MVLGILKGAAKFLVSPRKRPEKGRDQRDALKPKAQIINPLEEVKKKRLKKKLKGF